MMNGDPDSRRSRSAMEALLRMGKIDIATLKRAHAG
jgi:predicted 3-demethylubiquinone-9 3-methyltransferase (glyoxalase superfamily)